MGYVLMQGSECVFKMDVVFGLMQEVECVFKLEAECELMFKDKS